MKTTIDKGGRVVVPKKLRDQFHLLPGTEVEITSDADGIRLRPRDSRPSLVEEHGFLVHHGPEVADIDVVSFIARERESASSRTTFATSASLRPTTSPW